MEIIKRLIVGMGNYPDLLKKEEEKLIKQMIKMQEIN